MKVTGITVLHRLASHAASRPTQVALRQKRNGIWHESTWKDYWRMVGECALGLRSIGVSKGERVAILSTNRREWVVCHLGITLLGAVPVGLYASTTPANLAQQLRATRPVVVVCEDQEQFDKVQVTRSTQATLRSIVVLDMRGMTADASVLPYDDLARAGAFCAQDDSSATAAMLDALLPSRLTSVVLSSGTGGEHRAIEVRCDATDTLLQGLLSVEHFGEKDNVVSLLPLAHPTEQLFSLTMPISVAAIVNFPESRRSTLEDIREIAPTVFIAPPRVWEGLHREMLARRAETGSLRRRAFDWAHFTAQQQKGLQRTSLTVLDRLKAVSRAVVMQRNLRNFLGLSRSRFLGSVGAVAAPDALAFFRGIGLPLRNLYTLAEVGGLVAIGNVDEDGDILGAMLPTVAHGIGPGGTLGIHHETRFVDSGDVVEIHGNRIRLLGRITDQIEGIQGPRHPSAVERSLKSSAFIREALVSVDEEGQLQALVQIEPVAVGEWAKMHQIGFTTFTSLATNPQVAKLIAGVLGVLNNDLPQQQRVAGFALLHQELEVAEEELTPLLTVRRIATLRRHATRLAATMAV